MKALSKAYELAVSFLTRPLLPAIPTGFEGLDRWMGGGLHKKGIYVLAGRTREGKSALALSMARRMALEANAKVIYLSLEMSKEEMIARLYCQLLRRPLTEIEALQREGGLAQVAAPALALLQPAWFHIEDEQGALVDHLAAFFDNLQLQGEQPDVLVIDHLQHIPMQYGVSRADALQTYMAELKAFAKRRNLVILLCCQINRAGKDKPSLENLKGSGGIEEVSDLVFICNRVGYESASDPQQAKEECEYEIWVAKQRRGPEFKITVRFHPAWFEFSMPPKYTASHLSQLDPIPVIEDAPPPF